MNSQLSNVDSKRMVSTMDFLFLAKQCAPDVHPDTMRRIVQVESSFNPYAIGVVGGRLERQPRRRDEAIATAQWLEQKGYNYSVGLAQVNQANFAHYGLTIQTAFDACPNLRAGGEILKACFHRANKTQHSAQIALRDAFSCYYAGNFTTGYRLGYVAKIVAMSTTTAKPVPLPVAIHGLAGKQNAKPQNLQSARYAIPRASAEPHDDPDIVSSALLF